MELNSKRCNHQTKKNIKLNDWLKLKVRPAGFTAGVIKLKYK